MIPSFQRFIFLLGVGGSGVTMRPLAEELALPTAAAFPDGPYPFDMGVGRQWFSVKGVSEANGQDRIAEAMPAFIDLIEALGDAELKRRRLASRSAGCVSSRSTRAGSLLGRNGPHVLA